MDRYFSLPYNQETIIAEKLGKAVLERKLTNSRMKLTIKDLYFCYYKWK